VNCKIEEEEEGSSISLVVLGRAGGALSGGRAIKMNGSPSEEVE
jgi:hypothetical protein